MTPLVFKLKCCLLSRADNLPQFDPFLIQLSSLPTYTLFPSSPEQCALPRAPCSSSCLQTLENGAPTTCNALELAFLIPLASIYPLLLSYHSLQTSFSGMSAATRLRIHLSHPLSRYVIMVGYLPDLTLVELFEGKFKILSH